MSVNTKVNGQLVKSAGLYKTSVPIQSGDIYSFEERQVGVWVSGKSLYQKTLEYNKTNIQGNINFDITSDMANVDEVVAYESRIDYVVQGQSADSSYYSDDLVRLSKTGSSYGIYLTIGQATFSTANIYMTIQYTKTTDVAGSGEYVPSGDKAVHYSTEEEVIGTWFGETLYRRTITGLSIQLNGTTWVNYNPSISIDKLIDVHAYYEPSGGLMTCAIAEYQYNSSVGIQLTAVQGYNRTVNILTIEYTKSS